MYKDRKRINKNGYIVVSYPEHPRAFDTGTGMIGVYEHMLVAEEILKRPLFKDEVVHHLDGNRSNNSPSNLLILTNAMHGKLHAWLSRNKIKLLHEKFSRKQNECNRCIFCDKPINPEEMFCSKDCYLINLGISFNKDHGKTKPTKEVLEKLVWEKPTTQVAKDFGVSDVAIAKLCKKYKISKPTLGYWAKKQSTK